MAKKKTITKLKKDLWKQFSLYRKLQEAIDGWCNCISCEDKGWGIKSPDWWLVDGCSICHDIIDGRKRSALTKLEINKCILRALYRTINRRIEQGLISVD